MVRGLTGTADSDAVRGVSTCTHTSNQEADCGLVPTTNPALVVPVSGHNDDIRNHECLHSMVRIRKLLEDEVRTPPDKIP